MESNRNRNQIELQACESKSNRIVKFVSIPSPNGNPTKKQHNRNSCKLAKLNT